MSEEKGITTLMVLLTALGALAIIILFAWVFFFNPTNLSAPIQDKPELAALENPPNLEETVELPGKSAEEQILADLQEGNAVPLLLEGEEQTVVISINEDKADQVSEEPTEVIAQVEPTDNIPVALVVEAPKEVVEAPVVKKTIYKDVTETIYWLQVGSFPNSQVAENLRTSLKSSGIDSIIKTITVNETLYYRVRVGAFQSEIEAKSFKNKLLALDDIEEVVVYTDYVTRTIEVN